MQLNDETVGGGTNFYRNAMRKSCILTKSGRRIPFHEFPTDRALLPEMRLKTVGTVVGFASVQKNDGARRNESGITARITQTRWTRLVCSKRMTLVVVSEARKEREVEVRVLVNLKDESHQGYRICCGSLPISCLDLIRCSII